MCVKIGRTHALCLCRIGSNRELRYSPRDEWSRFSFAPGWGNRTHWLTKDYDIWPTDVPERTSAIVRINAYNSRCAFYRSITCSYLFNSDSKMDIRSKSSMASDCQGSRHAAPRPALNV